MSKLYYTDPLASAYMTREFKVQVMGRSTNLAPYELDLYELLDLELNGQEDVLDQHKYTSYLIHPDSYHIFEPQVGDLLSSQDKGKRIYQTVVGSEYSDFSGKEVVLQTALFRVEQGKYDPKIIQRDGKPFFTPENEVDKPANCKEKWELDYKDGAESDRDDEQQEENDDDRD